MSCVFGVTLCPKDYFLFLKKFCSFTFKCMIHFVLIEFILGINGSQFLKKESLLRFLALFFLILCVLINGIHVY